MTQCFTCCSNLNEFQKKFILYQCFVCKEKTLYCIQCSSIVSKLLSSHVFKCCICNSITKIMTKEEVIFTNDDDTYNERESEVYLTPNSGFLSINTPNKLISNNSFVFQTPRSNNSFKEEDWINDFSKLNLALSNKENNEECLSQRYQLLRSKRRNITPRKSDLLSLSLNENNTSKCFYYNY